MKDKFYQVFHGHSSVGFFKHKKNAEKYAKQFMSKIEGYDYKLKVKELDFLDNLLKGDLDDDNYNWEAWKE